MKPDDVFQNFLADSLEVLQDCEDGVAELGNEQDNGYQVDFLFRSYHSIKGSAGMLGLPPLEMLAHSIEDLLDKIRRGGINVDDNLKELLVEGKDALEGMIVRAGSESSNLSLLPEEENLINRIRSLGKGECSLDNLLCSFLRDIKEMISEQGNRKIEQETCQKIIARIEILDLSYRNLTNSEQWEESTKIEHDNSIWVIGQEDTTELVRSISKFFQGENVHQAQDPEKVKQILLKIGELDKIGKQDSNSRLRTLIKKFDEDFTAVITSLVGLDETMFGIFKDHWSRILEQAEFHPTGDEPHQPANIETEDRSEQMVGNQEKTLRIPESRLDNFLYHVAELIIMNEHSSNFLNQIEMVPDVLQLQSLVKEFSLHSSKIHKEMLGLESSLRETRKVQVKNITRKAQRQIRKLAKKMGKKVSLEIEGDSIEVDKMIIEKLDDPLMHILRNCLDHGLESPFERIKSGKDETGKISILLKKEKKSLVLIVSDDGQGIDLEMLKAKAIADRLFSIDQLEKMDPSEISRLIFRAGLSTAKEVTTISGRGVGMDVVRKNVEVLKGSIDVRTERFKGTTITILIPLKDDLVVSKGVSFCLDSSKFIIEASNLIEIIASDKVEKFSIQGHEMVRVRDTTYPLVDFRTILGEGGQTANLNENRLIFILEAKKGQICLFADEVLGSQSFVIEEIKGFLNNINICKGTSILKDGSIGLVLDVDSIIDEYYYSSDTSSKRG